MKTKGMELQSKSNHPPSRRAHKEAIIIEGVRTHNLKNISVSVPKGKITVVTGPSGSGKSSLAFDTIYAEGQRRYIESLSAYVRQFLERMERPDIDSIHGIGPTVAIEQRKISRNPRSTVATMTEIYDYMRLLFGRVGKVFCTNCKIEVKKYSPEDIIGELGNHRKINRLYILVQVKNSDKPNALEQIKSKGYFRLVSRSKPAEVLDISDVDKYENLAESFILLDRLSMGAEDFRERFIEACEQGFEIGDGSIYVYSLDDGALLKFPGELECRNCGTGYVEPEPRLFSFNNPYGACPSCQGFGTVLGYDFKKSVVDPSLSILKGAIALINAPAFDLYRRSLSKAGSIGKIRLDEPVGNLTGEEWEYLINGDEIFPGLLKFVKALEKRSHSFSMKYFLDKYRGYVTCPECGGARLRRDALAVYVDGKNIFDVVQMTISEARGFFSRINLQGSSAVVAEQILAEIQKRIEYLDDIGLGYLTLDRLSSTLSGGEAQRVALSHSLASTLVSTIYVLDEPSIGLHPRDINRLIKVLKKLKSYDNTVIVVEHDPEIMRSGDYIIDLGPGSGTNGGQVIFHGTYKELLKSEKSLTAIYLRGERRIGVPGERKKPTKFIHIKGANLHNIRNTDVHIPLDSFVCITGVSGSGKSTLVYDILHASLSADPSDYQQTGNDTVKVMPRNCREIILDHAIRGVEMIDQSSVSRMRRSNVATYSGAFDGIRVVFSQTPLARERGLSPSYFSFNVDWGGRCEACEGEGVQIVEMQFLADVTLECEVCKGKRYSSEALEVKYHGKDISEVLDMTVDDAADFFGSRKEILKPLKILQRVGLGYMKLGQRLSTLSGGEAQRLKISSYLSSSAEKDMLFLLDEPTTGLHFDEISRLLDVLFDLRDKGNSIVVVEHNLDVIKNADYIIDLGPEAGEGGGRVVAAGTPEEVASIPGSYTGRFLKKVLEKVQNAA
ncbi:MAG: excinuclease ABC subunit UvrA [Candidatus Kryptoniota bacterium]